MPPIPIIAAVVVLIALMAAGLCRAAGEADDAADRMLARLRGED